MHHSMLDRKQSTVFRHPGRCGIAERPGDRWVLSKEAQSVALLSPEAMAKTTVWVTDATVMPMDQLRPAIPSWSSRTIAEAMEDRGTSEQCHYSQTLSCKDREGTLLS